VFAYRDHGSGPHTVTLSLFQIPVKWFKFFRFKSNPKLYCKVWCEYENRILLKSKFLPLLFA